MKTPVIDSVRMAANDGIYPELGRIAGINCGECPPKLDSLKKQLESLPLDTKTTNEIMNLGTDIFSAGAESGFRRGFRIGMRLMVESLGAPEDPETGGGI